MGAAEDVGQFVAERLDDALTDSGLAGVEGPIWAAGANARHYRVGDHDVGIVLSNGHTGRHKQCCDDGCDSWLGHDNTPCPRRPALADL